MKLDIQCSSAFLCCKFMIISLMKQINEPFLGGCTLTFEVGKDTKGYKKRNG